MNDQPNHYQLTYLLSPLLDEKGVNAIGQKIKKWIEEQQGRIAEEKTINKNLAYPIKKQGQGIYSNLSFQLSSQSIEKLPEQLKLEGHILRYMVQKRPIKRERQKEPLTILSRTTFSARPSVLRSDLSERPKITEKELLKKPAPTLPQKEKVKLEELDKKLEEILNE